MSQHGIVWIKESFSIHGYDTFKKSPKFFFQFYVIYVALAMTDFEFAMQKALQFSFVFNFLWVFFAF